MNPFSMAKGLLLGLLCLGLAGFGTAYAQSNEAAAVPEAANPVPLSASSPGALNLVVDPNNSQASYHAHEQLAGNDLPSDAVGTTHGVSGMVVINPDAGGR
jgi:hypothetical protein